MRLFRFIGEKEYNSLLSGEKQTNDFDWSIKYETTSKGICFFTNNRTNDINRIVEVALDDWCYSGIVKEYAIVEVEVDRARKAKGFYASGFHTEYNLFEYDLSCVTNVYRIHGKYWERQIEKIDF